MHKKQVDLIRRIADVRVNNNVLWMRFVELALKHAPEDAKAAMKVINANDRLISEMFAELAK